MDKANICMAFVVAGGMGIIIVNETHADDERLDKEKKVVLGGGGKRKVSKIAVSEVARDRVRACLEAPGRQASWQEIRREEATRPKRKKNSAEPNFLGGKRRDEQQQCRVQQRHGFSLSSSNNRSTSTNNRRRTPVAKERQR